MRRTGDHILDMNFDEVERRVKRLENEPDVGHVVIKDVELADGALRRVHHKLGRKWEGWEICDMRGAVSSGRIQSVAGADEASELWLLADGYGAAVTVRVKVF